MATNNYILLEANRINQSGFIDEEADKYKNKWLNNVNSSGIEINIGDTIEVAGVAVNSSGASDNTIEFTGLEGINKEYADNQQLLEFEYYINHVGTNTAPLPFYETITFCGNKDALADGALPYSTISMGQRDGVNAKYNLLSRSLGEPDLGGFNTSGATTDINKYDKYNYAYDHVLKGTTYTMPPQYNRNYENHSNMPNNNFLCRLELFNDPQYGMGGAGYYVGQILRLEEPDQNDGNVANPQPTSTRYRTADNTTDMPFPPTSNGAPKTMRQYQDVNINIEVTMVGDWGNIQQWKMIQASNGVQGPSSRFNYGTIESGSILICQASGVTSQGASGTGPLSEIRAWFVVSGWLNQNYPTFPKGWNSNLLNIPNWNPGPGYVGPLWGEMTAAPITPSTPPKFNIMRDYFSSKVYRQPDGQRYYFGPENWTGVALTKETPTAGLEAENYNFEDLNPTYTPLISQTELEIPVGFSTSASIGQIITDRLHQPILDTSSSAVWTDDAFDFVSLDNYGINGLAENTIINNETQLYGPPPSKYRRPTVLSTNTWKPKPANFAGICNKSSVLSNLAGARNLFWSNIAVREPEKWAGLSYTRGAYYGADEDDPLNEISSGSVDGTRLGQVGDMNSQDMGTCGINQSILNKFPATAGPKPSLSSGSNPIILTNMFYTEANVIKIAESFKKAEKYWGDLTTKVSVTDFSEYAVGMDIGLYIDELSAGTLQTDAVDDHLKYPLNPTIISDATIHKQRVRFKTYVEADDAGATDQKSYVYTDGVAGDLFCYGTQLNGIPNDELQLSQMVIKSRYDPAFDYRFNKTSTSFSDFMTYNDVAGGSPDLFTTSGSSQDDIFVGGQNINVLMQWAIDNDVMVLPIFPSSQTNFITNGNRPLLAYVSKFAFGNTTVFDPQTREGQWQIDPHNCTQNIQLGLDCSFIRNDAVAFYNTQPSTTQNYWGYDTASYNSIGYIGASNPVLNFSTDLGRFTLSGLSTPMTIGNSNPEQLQQFLTPNASPDTTVFAVNKKGSICPYKQQSLPANIASDEWNTNLSPATGWGTYIDQFNIPQKEGTIMDAYTGLSLSAIYNKDNKGNWIKLSNTDYDKYGGSLLSKLGFNLNQLLPLIGSVQTQNISGVNNDNQDLSYGRYLLENTKPLTTGAYISSVEYQSLDGTGNNLPEFGLGGDNGYAFMEPLVNSSLLIANRLPAKLEYSYINVYSSIIQGGTNTSYYGGSDGKSQIPVLAFCSRNYTAGDFFYGLEQTFTYTALRNFTLTDITTDLRLPDGSRPLLEKNSSVIYKITKSETLPLTGDEILQQQATQLKINNIAAKKNRLSNAQ